MFFRRLFPTVAAVVLLLAGCAKAVTPSRPQSPSGSADKPTELRGVWVSFSDLQNLLQGCSPKTAAARLEEMTDVCVQAGLNTIFFHARSHSDAWYASSLFPAATAAAPLLADGFDPLAHTVKAAHERGLSVHGWINPYRIGTDRSKAVIHTENALFQKDGVWYYNPADEKARQCILDGVRELLDGYALDGIHFDDYFYPDGMQAQGEPFEHIPSHVSPTRYRQTQVDILVSAVYGLCHRADRLFGISPMASLQQNREVRCADVGRWMREAGYVDYVCPQLYVGFAHETSPFDELLTEWLSLPRRKGVSLYSGLALYKAGLTEDSYAGSGKTEWATHSDILARQLQQLRQQQADGFVLFRYQQLTDTHPAVAAEREALLEIIKNP